MEKKRQPRALCFLASFRTPLISVDVTSLLIPPPCPLPLYPKRLTFITCRPRTMAPAADAALPLPVDPTAPPSPPSPSGAGAGAAPASSDRPWYKYLFRTTFFFGGDPERAAARFAAFRHFDKMADTTVSREDIRAFVASDGVYGPRLAADETQATVRGTLREGGGGGGGEVLFSPWPGGWGWLGRRLSMRATGPPYRPTDPSRGRRGLLTLVLSPLHSLWPSFFPCPCFLLSTSLLHFWYPCPLPVVPFASVRSLPPPTSPSRPPLLALFLRTIGLAGLLSGAAMASSMARRSGSVFPTAIIGALLGGVTGHLLADHVRGGFCGLVLHLMAGWPPWRAMFSDGVGPVLWGAHGRSGSPRTGRVACPTRVEEPRWSSCSLTPRFFVVLFRSPAATHRLPLLLPPPCSLQVASWALGTYKHDQVATRAALTAFVQQREQAPPSGATGGGASVASS